MKRIKCGNRKGFTIIETSLVLAIAGLILVMAFIALPALQRQQRDTKRKDDTMLFAQAIKKYQQNNRGALPPSSFYADGADWDNYIDIGDDVEEYSQYSSYPWAKVYVDYLGKDFVSPRGKTYGIIVLKCNSDNGCDLPSYSFDSINNEPYENQDFDWFVFVGATCENGKPIYSSNNRNVAILTKLETGGAYCANT